MENQYENKAQEPQRGYNVIPLIAKQVIKIDSLEEQLQYASQDIARLNNENRSLKKEAEILKQENDALKVAESEQKGNYALIRSQIQEVVQDNESLRRECSLLRETIKSLEIGTQGYDNAG